MYCSVSPDSSGGKKVALEDAGRYAITFITDLDKRRADQFVSEPFVLGHQDGKALLFPHQAEEFSRTGSALSNIVIT